MEFELSSIDIWSSDAHSSEELFLGVRSLIFEDANFLALILSTERLFRIADFIELLLPRFPLSEIV